MKTRHHRRRFGLFVALLALAAQILLGITTPDAGVRPTPDQQLAALLADPAAICHGDVGGGSQPPHHHGVDCVLCPYCAAVTTAAVLRSGDVTLPAPRAGPIAIAIAGPESLALAFTPRLAARPRGPPILA